MRLGVKIVSIASLLTSACGYTPPSNSPLPSMPDDRARTAVPTQIIGTRADGSARELLDKGERSLLAQKWREAADAFETLLAAEPNGPRTLDALFGLGAAYEGLELRDKSRTAYADIVRRFPESPLARAALGREAQLDAYLEDWAALGADGDALLARKDLDDVDRLTGLGARGLSKIELGDDAAAMHDIQDGLELAEGLHYGTTGRLPVPAAQLRFALGEIRRVRSQRLKVSPVVGEFMPSLNVRCAAHMEAQSAYSDAIRSIDMHWAAMAAFRIGDMYRTLHTEVMNVRPQNAKTESDKQLFYGFMHLQYRALLEKGIEMLRRTLTISEAGLDNSSWIKRAEKAKAEMESALEEEKAIIKQFPYTEAELGKAIQILEKKHPRKADTADSRL